MNKPMADIATAALKRGLHAQGYHAIRRRTMDLSDEPAVADIWTDDDLGFALLLHRRKDGFVASELYYSTRDSGLRWTDAEHLSGGIVGFDPAHASASEQILNDATLVVLSASESRLSTNRSGYEDEGELIRVYELLVSESVDHIRIEKHTTGSAHPRIAHTSLEKSLTSPVAVVAVRPGELLHVVPAERRGSTAGATGEGIDLHPAEA